MKDAKQFAESYYSKFQTLQKEMEAINDLEPKGQFPLRDGFRLNAVRRGKYKRLFIKYDIYADFQKFVWKESSVCAKFIQQNEDAAAEYDRL
jgi:hypothetical protein